MAHNTELKKKVQSSWEDQIKGMKGAREGWEKEEGNTESGRAAI